MACASRRTRARPASSRPSVLLTAVATPIAELLPPGVVGAACGTFDRSKERRGAFSAELRALWVLVAARWTEHGAPDLQSSEQHNGAPKWASCQRRCMALANGAL